MKSFKEKAQKYFIVFFIILMFLNIIVSWFFNLDKSEIISLTSASIALVAAVLASMAVVYQLKANNGWNLRHTALIGVYDRQDFSSAVTILKKNIKYTNISEPISVEQIHLYICNNGNCRGELLDLSKEGLKTSDSIFTILNYYEYLAIGIKSNIMDEEVIKSMVKGSLLNAYRVFSLYIEHLRSDRHNKLNIYIDMEKLAKKWLREDNEDFEQRESTV